MESETENSETVPAVKNKAPCYYMYANLLEQKKVFT